MAGASGSTTTQNGGVYMVCVKAGVVNNVATGGGLRPGQRNDD